jgi:hypothetical protein
MLGIRIIGEKPERADRACRPTDNLLLALLAELRLSELLAEFELLTALKLLEKLAELELLIALELLGQLVESKLLTELTLLGQLAELELLKKLELSTGTRSKPPAPDSTDTSSISSSSHRTRLL